MQERKRIQKTFSPLKKVYHYNSLTKELELVEGETINISELINSYPVTTLDKILEYGLYAPLESSDDLYLLDDTRDKLDIAREAEDFRCEMVEKYNLPFDVTIAQINDYLANKINTVKENIENEKKKEKNDGKSSEEQKKTSEEA